MATEIFNVPYATIIMVSTIGGSFMGSNVDEGTFTDDGETPPVNWSATANSGQWLVGGSIASIVGVLALNPDYVPPSE